MTRRAFSATSLAVTAVSAQERKPIRLGAPIFLKSDDPAALAREHKRLRYTAAQCPPVTLADSARIEAIRKAYAAENVAIAEVGAWVNILHPDPATRKKNLEYVIERMQIADARGSPLLRRYRRFVHRAGQRRSAERHQGILRR